MRLILKFSLFLLTISVAQAAPVIIDTPTAHIIVARPADAWSSDASASDANLDALRQRRLAYKVATAEGTMLNGNPAVFSGISDHPITKGVEAELAKLGATLARGGENRNTLLIRKPVSMDGKAVADLLVWQRRLYEKTVIDAGNPDKAEQSVTLRKWLGGAASLAVMVVAGQQMGVGGANTALGAGVTDDVYRAAYEFNPSVVPVPLPAIDLSAYGTADVRRVDTLIGKRVGQIIIAYKTDKTPEVEQDAVVKAIVAVSSMDEDPEDVTKARAEDFMRRKAIWAACVQSGQCKASGD